ncbi:hypothetical protein Q8F55_002983 [Vanrija albida]|uniref:F-box domain-containing protein n=1 Tax=Vanrija albida TaxID=181172 RepID=A0ABR3QBB6_9TREE
MPYLTLVLSTVIGGLEWSPPPAPAPAPEPPTPPPPSSPGTSSSLSRVFFDPATEDNPLAPVLSLPEHNEDISVVVHRPERVRGLGGLAHPFVTIEWDKPDDRRQVYAALNASLIAGMVLADFDAAETLFDLLDALAIPTLQYLDAQIRTDELALILPDEEDGAFTFACKLLSVAVDHCFAWHDVTPLIPVPVTFVMIRKSGSTESITLALVPALPGLEWHDGALATDPLGAVRALPDALAAEQKPARVAGHGAALFPAFTLSWATPDDLATVAAALNTTRASALAITSASPAALAALLPHIHLAHLQTLEFRTLAAPSAAYVDFPYPALLAPKDAGIPIAPLAALLGSSRARALAHVVLRPTVPNMLASQKRVAAEFRAQLLAALPEGHGVDGVCVGVCALRSADAWDDLSACKCHDGAGGGLRKRRHASAARVHAASAALLHAERDDPARACPLLEVPYEVLEMVLGFAAQDDVLDCRQVRSVTRQAACRDTLRRTLAAFAQHADAGLGRARVMNEWCVNGGL